MKTGCSVCVAIAAIVLAGCGTMPVSGPPTIKANPDCPLTGVVPTPNVPCSHANCPLWVQVVTNQSDGMCEVIVEANVLKMAKANSATLNWWMPRSTATLWEFRPESGPYTLPVNFKDQNAPGLREQFSPAVVQASKTQVDVFNKNTNKQPYDYKIRVYKMGSTNTWIESRDPTVINDF